MAVFGRAYVTATVQFAPGASGAPVHAGSPDSANAGAPEAGVTPATVNGRLPRLRTVALPLIAVPTAVDCRRNRPPFAAGVNYAAHGAAVSPPGSVDAAAKRAALRPEMAVATSKAASICSA